MPIQLTKYPTENPTQNPTESQFWKGYLYKLLLNSSFLLYFLTMSSVGFWVGFSVGFSVGFFCQLNCHPDFRSKRGRGGNFDNFISKQFIGRVPCCNFLTILMLWKKTRGKCSNWPAGSCFLKNDHITSAYRYPCRYNYMVIFPKSTSVTRVPRVQPINT